MRDIEFVSYDGQWPNLCSGELIILIDGETIECGNCLCSGGGVSRDDEYEFTVTSGDWSVDFDELQHLNLTRPSANAALSSGLLPPVRCFAGRLGLPCGLTIGSFFLTCQGRNILP